MAESLSYSLVIVAMKHSEVVAKMLAVCHEEIDGKG